MRSALQPLACVLYASSSCPTSRARHVAVHRTGLDRAAVLLCGKGFGRRHVTGVDPIDRDDVGQGVRGGHRGARDQRPLGEPPRTARQARRRDRGGRPSGRDPRPRDRRGRVRAARSSTSASPDDDSYPISMRTMLRNNLTLKSGVTLDRRRVLERRRRVRARSSRVAAGIRHPHLRRRRGAGRVRTGLPPDTGTHQDRDRGDDQRADCRMRSPPKSGSGADGWWDRPSSAPRSSPRPGTTTSGSTSSTAISTTPTSHCCCAGSSTFRSPPRCDCRRRTPRPSAGCSTRVPTRSSSRWSSRAEQAAAAVAATRYAPAGVRSFGPLRASLGLDPAELRGAGPVCSR